MLKFHYKNLGGLSMSDIKNETSIGGLKATAVAFIAVISYFFTVFGIILPILILFLEQKNEFVRHYAKQTLAVTLVSMIAIALNLVVFVGTFIFAIVIITFIIFQIIAAINAISGKVYEIPYIGKVVKLLFNN